MCHKNFINKGDASPKRQSKVMVIFLNPMKPCQQQWSVGNNVSISWSLCIWRDSEVKPIGRRSFTIWNMLPLVRLTSPSKVLIKQVLFIQTCFKSLTSWCPSILMYYAMNLPIAHQSLPWKAQTPKSYKYPASYFPSGYHLGSVKVTVSLKWFYILGLLLLPGDLIFWGGQCTD